MTHRYCSNCKMTVRIATIAAIGCLCPVCSEFLHALYERAEFSNQGAQPLTAQKLPDGHSDSETAPSGHATRATTVVTTGTRPFTPALFDTPLGRRALSAPDQMGSPYVLMVTSHTNAASS